MVVLSWSKSPRLWSVPELTELEAQVPNEDWTLKEDWHWLERMVVAGEW